MLYTKLVGVWWSKLTSGLDHSRTLSYFLQQPPLCITASFCFWIINTEPAAIIVATSANIVYGKGLGPFACFMIILASLVVENCVHILPQLVRHWRFDLSICKVGNKIVLIKANSNPGTLQPGSSWQENITVTIQQQPHSFSNQVDICALNNILQYFPTASATTPCAWHGRRAGRRGWSSRRWRRRWKWRWRPGARDWVECHPQH